MDFPLFHWDTVNNRVLIGVIAVLHVLINHPLAIGAFPLISLMERLGMSGDARWDGVARKFAGLCFVVTTTIGALTGVGIWFSAALVSPVAIGSMLRVFFWAWFVEWFIFIVEVLLIMAYHLTWEQLTGERKRTHWWLGVALAGFSFLTLVVIVGILSYMMDPGRWLEHRSIWNGWLNPLTGPQMLFRTGFSMVSAGLVVLLAAPWWAETEFRPKVNRLAGIWTLAWLPVCVGGAVWYWRAIPDSMVGNLAVAVGTQAFAEWYGQLAPLVAVAGAAIALVAAWSIAVPRLLPRVAAVVPFVLAIAMLGMFERVREFIRKPFVIGGYLYSNGIRVEEYPLLNSEGILKYATYSSVRTITPENHLQAGEEVFRIACTRCHTTGGLNGVIEKLETLFPGEWKQPALTAYLRNMHNVRPYMPPFPGNPAELDAMTSYLMSIRRARTHLAGAQTAGIRLAPEAPAP